MQKEKSEYSDTELILQLTNQYSFICLVDAKNGTFRVLRANHELKALVSCFHKMNSVMIAFAEAHIDRAYRKRFRDFCNIEQICQCFLNGERFKEETFVNIRGEWIRFRVIPAPGFSKDNPVGIVTFENRTKNYQSEENDIIETQMNVRSYAWIGRIDIEKKKYESISGNDEESWFPKNGTTKSLRALLQARMPKDHNGNFDKVYENGDHPEYGYVEEEFAITDDEGKNHYYAVYCAKISDEAEKHYLIFARNNDEENAKRIEQKKEKEQRMIQLIEEQNEALKVALDTAEAASKAKSVFLSNMSHDIRTPMNAITGMTNIAKQNIQDPDKVLDCLNKISTASNHLLSLINNILDMSKIENGIATLNEDKFVFSEMMEDIYDIVQPQLKSRKLRMKISTSGIIHDHLIGDTLRLRQAFINIIGNSIKFTPEGGSISVRIRELKETHAGYGTFCCTFTDNGIGMTPEFKERIFEPFEREKNMTMSKVEGTGLGMAITKNIIEMMNGHIKVKSELGKGTSFKIVIHLKMQENIVQNQNGEQVPSEPEDYASIDYSSKRMLLVEDNELNMEIAEDIIGMTGIRIEKAWDGREAVEMVEKSPEGYYDMILCDIQMPFMNGYIATTKIREMNRNDVKTIPIVAMTANAFAEDRQKALDVGMNEHISKPFDMQNLFEVMYRFLGHKL